MPWTGLNSHHQGAQVRISIQDGDLQGALDTLQNNKVKFNPKALLSTETEVAKEVRSVLPFIDTLSTEHLRGNTAVMSSLIGALFSDAKSTIKVDLAEALQAEVFTGCCKSC